MSIPEWKTALIELALQANILGFGSFKLKSGRISPYFVNCGRFCEGPEIQAISKAYARTVDEHAQQSRDFGFDVLFGPAYKGIPLAATTTCYLQELDPRRWHGVGFAYNRKEAKDHGEGGTMVGKSLKGQRVVIIDDVITAGTAIREAIDLIAAQGGTLVGIVVAIDRQEKMPSPSERDGKGDDGTPRGSAIGAVKREHGVPVLAVLTLDDIVQGVKALGKHAQVQQMEDYRQQYGATD